MLGGRCVCVCVCVQLGGVIEPNREQCYLNANGVYVESINEVRR